MLTLIASVPRSGNTLFRILLHAYSGLPTYSCLNDPLLVNCKAVGQRKLPVGRANVCRLQNMPDTYFVKTHSQSPAEWACAAAAFYVVRDPRAVVVSLSHYRAWQKGQRPSAWYLAQLIQDGWLRNGWSMHVKAWLDAEIKCAVVRYEDMLSQPYRTVSQAVESLGLDIELNDKEYPSFESLHARMPKFFRRGKVDAWKDELSPTAAKVLWEQAKNAAMRLGYTEEGWRGGN